jgi:tetratricopeptide (TPR) repeat protein
MSAVQAPLASERPSTPSALADDCYERAIQLLKKRDYPNALQEVSLALRSGAARAEHDALYAWLLCHDGGAFRIHPRAFAHLERALRRDPLCERAHYYKGMLLKQLGRADEAHFHFVRATQVNRDNVEAAREVRLYDMRQRREKPSLIQKLLRFGGDE